MLAYDSIVSSYAREHGVGKSSEEAMVAATSHHAIEELVKGFSSTLPKQELQRKKKTLALREKQLNIEEEEISEEAKKNHWIAFKKRDSRPTPKKALVQNSDSQESRLNPPVNMESQEQIYRAHRGADTTDANYINTEVDDFLLGLREDC